MYGRYYEELEVGKTYVHSPGKTITECDNNFFSLMTMNHHPIHIDKNFAMKQHPGKILIVGTYVFSLVVGQSVRDISGKAIANLEYESIKHIQPSYIGDTIYSKTTVLEKRVSKTKPDRGIVYVETIAYNQEEDPVLTLRRRVLIPLKGNDK
jgi:acyl dehydratase